MVYVVDLVRAEQINMPVLVGVGLSVGKVISVGSDWRHKGGSGHPEIPRKGNQTEICTVSQRCLMLKLTRPIQFIGLLFN